MKRREIVVNGEKKTFIECKLIRVKNTQNIALCPVCKQIMYESTTRSIFECFIHGTFKDITPVTA